MDTRQGGTCALKIFSAGFKHANCLHRAMHICEFKVCHLQARPRAKYLHAFGRRSPGEILNAFGRGRRSTREILILGQKLFYML